MEVILGVVMGFMTGVVLAAKFLRHEIAGMVEPRLEHIEQQLHNLRQETNLDAATRFAALSKLLEDRHPHDLRGQACGPAQSHPRLPRADSHASGLARERVATALSNWGASGRRRPLAPWSKIRERWHPHRDLASERRGRLHCRI